MTAPLSEVPMMPRPVPATGAKPVALSIVVPVYNEDESVAGLCAALFDVLDGMGVAYEIIAINDGSRDRSFERLAEIASRRRELKVIGFSRNFGQTAAIMAGIDHAAGDVIVTIDADLQNDPKDIPALVAKLDEGFDVVSGWRKERKDAAITRNLVSRIANSVISSVSGVALKDYGCTLKAYRREVFEGVRLYGEMHRFVPIFASWQGARVTEMPVHHEPRKFGRSNYGLERIFKVILDLLVVKFLDRHLVKPIYIFGGFGLFSLMLSVASGLLALYWKIFDGVSFILTPLPLFATMTFLVGLLSILVGMIAEVLIRTYFESQGRKTYAVRTRLNL